MSEAELNGFSVKPFGSSDDLPDGCIVVNTYHTYLGLIEKWLNGKLDSTLVVIGAAGVGKSETALRGFKELGIARGTQYAYMAGHNTKYYVYSQIYAHIDQPLVFDDVDDLLSDASTTALLKQLFGTGEEKIVQWGSGKTLSDDSALPSEIVTKSRSLLLCNELKNVSKNFGAVLDRATLIYFAPKAEEVIAYTKTWWNMKEHKDVFDFVSERLHLMGQPSCRPYTLAKKWKDAGLEWQSMVSAKLKPSDVRATTMLDLINKHTDPKTGDYRKGAVKQLISEYMTAQSVTEQAAYAVKKAVEQSIGRISKKSASIAEGMKKKHADRKANTEGKEKPKAKKK